jgi:hypothetical protein
MMQWDHMLCLPSIQLCLLVVILVHISLTLVHYIPPHPALVELFPKFLISIIGMVVHLYMVTCQPPTQFLQWFFIITAGITLPPISPLAAAILVLLISPRYHKVIRGQQGVVRRPIDQDLICIPSLLVTGISIKFLYLARMLFSLQLYIA